MNRKSRSRAKIIRSCCEASSKGRAAGHRGIRALAVNRSVSLTRHQPLLGRAMRVVDRIQDAGFVLKWGCALARVHGLKPSADLDFDATRPKDTTRCVREHRMGS